MKKQFTRLLSLMLVLVMAFALLPTAALAAPAKTKEVKLVLVDQNGDKTPFGTVKVDEKATVVETTLVPENLPEGYKFAEENTFHINKNNVCKINVVKLYEIPCKYYSSEAPDTLIETKLLKGYDAGEFKQIKKKNVPELEGYTITAIEKSGTIKEKTAEIKVLVEPVLKSLEVRYQNTKNGFRLDEYQTTIQVPASAEAVTMEQIPMTEKCKKNYKLTGVVNDYIAEGYVYALVEPLNRTIAVSYVNAAGDVKDRERVSVPYGTTTLQQELLKRIPADYRLADTNDFTITDETTSVKLLVEPIPAEEHENEPDLGTKTIEVLWYLGAEPVGEPCQVEVPLEEDYVRKEVLRNLAAISGALPEGTEMAYPDADYLIEDGSVRVSVVRITKDVTIDVRYYAVYPFLQNTEILTFTVPVDTDPLTLVVEKSDLKQVLPGYSVYYVSEVREDEDGYYAIAMMSMDLEPDQKPNPKPDPKPDTKPSLNKEDHVAYIQGYEDGTFRPQGKITRAEAVTILYRLMDKADRNYYWDNVSDFKDVPKDAWYTTAVATMDNAGIIVDCKDNFRPNDAITRAELAVMAAQFTGKTYSGAASFSDVSSKYWAAEEIAMVEHMGWINGYPDGTFGPDKTITRAEAVAIINRMCERATKAEDMLRGLVTFPDVHTNDWFYEDVLEASNAHEFVRTNNRVEHQNYCYEEWTYLYK